MEEKVSQLAIQSLSCEDVDVELTSKKAVAAVAKLKVGKAQGPHGLTAEHEPDTLKVGNIILFTRVEARSFEVHNASLAN